MLNHAFDLDPDYEGFQITIDVKTPKYLGGKEKDITTVNGSGYFLFVSEKDSVTTVKHGYNHLSHIVKSMVRAANDFNALSMVIAETIACTLRDENVDLAKVFIQCADALREQLKLRQEQN